MWYMVHTRAVTAFDLLAGRLQVNVCLTAESPYNVAGYGGCDRRTCPIDCGEYPMRAI